MIKRTFRNMLLAQILSSASVTVCMLVDSMMIGRFLGVNAIAAYGIASPVLFIYAAFGALISTSIQIVCSKSLTKGDQEATNNCYTAAIILATTASVLGLIAIFVFTDRICLLLGAEQGTEVFDMTKKYLQGFISGAPAFIVSQILVPFLLLSNNRTLLVTAVLMMTVSDVVMDLLNVMFFNGGIFGMGVASAVSYYIALAVVLPYLISKKCIYKFVPKKFRLRNCLVLFKNGIPTAINQVCYTLMVYCVNLMLLSRGQSDGVAIFSVLSTVGSLCFSIGSGIGVVSLALSGVLFVEEDRHSMYELVGIFMRYAVFLDLIATVALMAVAKQIMGSFIADDEVLKMGAFALRIYILCLVPSSLNSTFKNYFMGIEKTGLSELVSVLQNFAFVVLAAYVYNTIFGTKGIWFAFVTGELLTLIVICIIAWVRNGGISFKAPVFAFLDKDFGVTDDNVLEIPIADMAEVTAASEKAQRFCQAHGGNNMTASRMALCIEEMGSNIIQHGFSDGKLHNMLLRVIDKGELWIIGLRDDCKGFDPVKYRKKHAFDNSYSRLGLKLVFETATEIRYVNTLGLNSLTIILQ